MLKKISIPMLLLLALFACFANAETEEVPNPGPRTSNEPKVLFDEGMAELNHSNFVRAAQSFQRLVDRYPLDANYVEANYYLGQSYLQAKQFKAALKPLKIHVKHHFHDDTGNRSRLLLIDCYLNLNLYSEARGMAEEMLKQNPSPELKQQALLLKSVVLTKQNRLSDAKASLDAYELVTEKNAHVANAALESKARFFLSTQECVLAKNPSPFDKSNEDEWLDYLQQLKTCFKASLARDLSLLQKSDLNDWCSALSKKEAGLKKMIKDRSFTPKLQGVFQDVKDFAKSKSLQCE